MAYKACIFDLDGTLANTLRSIAMFANHALRDCGYPEIPVETYSRLVGNGRVRLLNNMLHTVAPEGFAESEVERVGQLYDAYYAADPGAASSARRKAFCWSSCCARSCRRCCLRSRSGIRRAWISTAFPVHAL